MLLTVLIPVWYSSHGVVSCHVIWKETLWIGHLHVSLQLFSDYPSSVPPCFPLQSSSHCIHLNAFTDNYVRSFTSDKLFGLVDVGRSGIEGNLTLDNQWNRAMSSLLPMGLQSVGPSRVHSAITIREDTPPKLVGLYEHFLTFLKSLQTFVCMFLVLLYLTLQCKVRTSV